MLKTDFLEWVKKTEFPMALILDFIDEQESKSSPNYSPEVFEDYAEHLEAEESAQASWDASQRIWSCNVGGYQRNANDHAAGFASMMNANTMGIFVGNVPDDNYGHPFEVRDRLWGLGVLASLEKICEKHGITSVTGAVNTARHRLTSYDKRRASSKGHEARNNIFIEEMFDLFEFVPNDIFRLEVVFQCELIYQFEPTTLNFQNIKKIQVMKEWGVA